MGLETDNKRGYSYRNRAIACALNAALTVAVCLMVGPGAGAFMGAGGWLAAGAGLMARHEQAKNNASYSQKTVNEKES